MVCVDVRPCWNNPAPKEGRLIPPLILNQVYVVSSLGSVPYGDIVNLIGVNPAPHLGFHPKRFRLLSEIRSLARKAKSFSVVNHQQK